MVVAREQQRALHRWKLHVPLFILSGAVFFLFQSYPENTHHQNVHHRNDTMGLYATKRRSEIDVSAIARRWNLSTKKAVALLERQARLEIEYDQER